MNTMTDYLVGIILCCQLSLLLHLNILQSQHGDFSEVATYIATLIVHHVPVRSLSSSKSLSVNSNTLSDI